MQTELKLRQITQTTIKDFKGKIKDKQNEIEVLKEMVKSSNMQAKAKDIDIQRLTKKIQRMEKFVDFNKGVSELGHAEPQHRSSDMNIKENQFKEEQYYS